MSKQETKTSENLVGSADKTLTMPTLDATVGAVIGTATVDPKSVPAEETPKATKKKVEGKPTDEKVAVFSTGNKFWYGVGRLANGYNIISKAEADQWLTDSEVRLASPEEVKANVAYEGVIEE